MSNESKVAIFIDYDNIEMSVGELFGKGTDVDWSRILQTAASMGRVIMRRAYADWAQTNEREQRELLGMGVELVYVNTRRGKRNAADIRIAIDAIELLFNEKCEFTHFVLVSGDGDFMDLVHRLRAQGKVVIGMGVSGTSAEYLVNVCDKFLYYDKLQGVKSKKNNQNQPAAKTNGAGKANGAPAGQNRPPVSVTFPGPTTLEGKLEQYQHILSDHKIRIAPTEKRPAIVFKLYELKKNKPDLTFNQLKDEAQNYYTTNNLLIEANYVNDIAHQLFHTFCFEFDEDTSERIRILDRGMCFVPAIRKAPDLLDMCDRKLVQILVSSLGAPDKVDCEALATLLYGGVRTPRMLDHIQGLISAES